ncbi:MAG TPA: pyridoxamine 5'-phosphate oxidase family protein [Anaerolineaceae bacterium]|nr:pyridoxamine 5'-phosphate oxidase family protein [Anaerolineaceae bacterium]
MAKSSFFPGNGQSDRPVMPSGYGIQPVEDEKSLVSLQHINEQMKGSRNYWVCSSRPDGNPHAMPVWGVWLDEAFFFSTDPKSRKGRNLAANPHIVVHLESGDDVIILEGVVHIVRDKTILKRADEVYFEKYQFHLVENIESPGLVYQLDPQVAYAWFEKNFPASATRWKFK